MPIFFIAFLRMKNSKSEIRRLHDLHAYTVAPAYMSQINPPAPCKPTCRTPLFYHFRKIRIAWKKSWRHLYIWLFSQSMISWYKQKANWHVEFTMFTCFKTFNYCLSGVCISISFHPGSTDLGSLKLTNIQIQSYFYLFMQTCLIAVISVIPLKTTWRRESGLGRLLYWSTRNN